MSIAVYIYTEREHEGMRKDCLCGILVYKRNPLKDIANSCAVHTRSDKYS